MSLGAPLPPGVGPSTNLSMPDWIHLLHLVGQWDPAVSAEQVWERLDQWDRDYLASQETAQ